MCKRLSLHRETLRTLDAGRVSSVAGGRVERRETYDSGETYCWCSVSCPETAGCPPPSDPIETSRCGAM